MLENSKLDSSIPAPLLKIIAAIFPWLVLLFAMRAATGKDNFQQAMGGTVVVAAPFVIIAAMLPTYDLQWINYLAYPFVSVFVVATLILIWQKFKKTH